MIKRLFAVFVLVVLLLTVAPVGSPVRLSYVYSDSMEPTIPTNAGFFVVRGGVEQGDIATFWSPERDSYVTHRIVGHTEAGYVTKGDNNPTTDQAAGHPYVAREQVVGTVLTVGGTPVTIPGYGAAASALRDHLLLVGAGLLGLAFARQVASSSGRSRSVPRVRDVLAPLFAASLASAVAFLLVGAASHTFAYAAVASPTGAPNTIGVGETQTTTVTIDRTATPLTHTVVRTHNMHVTNQTRNASSIVLTAQIGPPASTGRYETRVTAHQYPAVLPPSTLRRLDRIHPVVPAAITTAIA
ncbi:MAG: signal peptidase I, partial [Haloarculaceae archaeon]